MPDGSSNRKEVAATGIWHDGGGWLGVELNQTVLADRGGNDGEEAKVYTTVPGTSIYNRWITGQLQILQVNYRFCAWITAFGLSFIRFKE